jgi:hypothetical protein
MVYEIHAETLIKDKDGKLYRKLHLLPYGLRNPCRNLKSENSADYAQKPINEIVGS